MIFLWSYELFYHFFPSIENASPAQLSSFFIGWFSILLAYHTIFMVIFWDYMKKKDFIMVFSMVTTTILQL